MQKELNKQFNPFEKLYNQALSADEIKEMKSNLVGFFNLLMEIDLRNKKEKGKENGNI